VVEHLRSSEETGVLPHFDTSLATVQEIRELTQTFNRAADAISTGREDLHRAYVECVGSLASALDARDTYTAGHSRRVSDFSFILAEAIGMGGQDLEILRVGALLHDIGKIGVPDCVLQKVGPLTSEEFALIKEHPAIGRRILEGVNGLAPYLSTVELHHENWDGSGYPHGLRGEETPLGARIVHVADAYDAMTSDRPYRKGMRSEDAVGIIQKHAGTQFDPRLADVFARLTQEGKITSSRREPDTSSLANLATAVGTSSPAVSQVVQSR
jgi:putative nucleotidyltransferase with HDIG domain